MSDLGSCQLDELESQMVMDTVARYEKRLAYVLFSELCEGLVPRMRRIVRAHKRLARAERHMKARARRRAVIVARRGH